MPDPLSWILIGILLFLSFFFSASETALACCNRFKLQVKADDGSHPAKLVIQVTEHYNRALSAVLIGHNIASIVMSVLMTILFKKYFDGTGMVEYASILASVILTFTIYIIGDAFPKTVAKAIPDTFSLIAIYPLYAFIIIFFPIVWFFDKLGELISIIFKQKSSEDFTEEDFENIVEQVSDEGIIEEEQGEIIQSALEFTDTKVKEVFTPLEKMYAIDIKDLNHEKVLEILMNSTFSRIPIYRNDYEHFIGVLHTKTYLYKYHKNPKVSVKSTLVKPYFVSQNIMLDDLFNGFKKHHTHIALVVDSNKKVIGMVTMEDVLEELISDISEPSIQKGGKE